MRAWLVTWEWVDDHAVVDEPVVAISSARTNAEEVRRYVERCYVEKTASFSEKLSNARYNQPREPPYPAKLEHVGGVRFKGRITCGHIPWLCDRKFWLWRAVDDEGEVLDFLVQRRRCARSARRPIRKLLKKQGFAPKRIITDKLKSYPVAIRKERLSAFNAIFCYAASSS